MPNPIKAVKGIVRLVGGITGKGSKNVNPVYKESGGHVKIVQPGTKRLTKPSDPYSDAMVQRSQSDLKRMGL